MSSNIPILRPPAPIQATVSIGSVADFIFDIDRETEITLQSDITDHYTEDVSPVQDHIALKPIKIVLKGYVGELVATKDELNKALQEAQPPKLGFVDSVSSVLNSTYALTGAASTALNFTNLVTPSLTRTVSNAQAKIGQSLSYIQTGTNLYNTTKQNYNTVKNAYNNIKSAIFGNTEKGVKSDSDFVATPANLRQQAAFHFFRYLWQNKILVSANTPYGQFDDMAIGLVSVRQPEESKYISDFSVTLQQFRPIDLKYVKFDPEKFQLRAANQREPIANLGKASGQIYTNDTYNAQLQAGGGVKLDAKIIDVSHLPKIT